MSHAEPYLMNDVGGTLITPRGWEMTRWSDWDFKAKGANSTIMYKLWLKPYQNDLNAETAAFETALGQRHRQSAIRAVVGRLDQAVTRQGD